ncbi:hypothetical protein H5410_037429 [Solanum commersonii]|uniref:Uncharacterized protein n=1 Tax=Solanum commersonii TaxID=4109 RepID=A0A9J5Y7T3_SOLCO|nr:hypothetical protein H5410_037429 [Solanum commersonii]
MNQIWMNPRLYSLANCKQRDSIWLYQWEQKEDVFAIMIDQRRTPGGIVPIGKVKNDTLSAFDVHIMTTHEQALREVTATNTYMPLYNTETSTIWGAEPEETLKN